MLKTIGITGGIGSLQYGAKKAGLKAVGNIEWRRYYHSGTFEHNFKGAWMVEEIEDLTEEQFAEIHGIDLAMGHPDCGAYSNLNSGKDRHHVEAQAKSDLPLFMELVSKIQPKFFIMDNLPKSLIGNPMEDWMEALPEYELFPEWVSNHHYGNVQKNRKRFFMLGCRKDIAKETGFVFIPGEFDQPEELTVKSVLTPYLNKYGKFPNHYKPDPNKKLGSLIVNKKGTDNIKPTLADASELFKSFGPGYQLKYYSHNYGCVRTRPGRSIFHWDGPANTLTGAYTTSFHPVTGWHLSTRERAAIQGIGDEFIFIHPKELDANGYDAGGSDLIKQTGKCMPVQFPEYFARQVKQWLSGKTPSIKNADRKINGNVYVTEAKIKYCLGRIYETGENPYSNQELACEMCLAKDQCDIGEDK